MLWWFKLFLQKFKTTNLRLVSVTTKLFLKNNLINGLKYVLTIIYVFIWKKDILLKRVIGFGYYDINSISKLIFDNNELFIIIVIII